jgi:hypothetical protein
MVRFLVAAGECLAGCVALLLMFWGISLGGYWTFRYMQWFYAYMS